MDAARVYVPLQNGSVVALDRQTGTEVWRRQLDSTRPPVVADGLVLMIGPEGLHALDADTGRPRWSIASPTAHAAVLAVAGNGVAVVAGAGLAAVAIADGRPIWTQTLEAPIRSSAVAAAEGVIVAALDGGRVAALDAADGTLRWQQRLSGDAGPVAVALGRAFVGSSENVLYALDLDDGSLAWRWRVGGDVVGVTADADSVYFVALDNLVRALSRSSGAQRWRADTGGRPAGALELIGGTLVVAEMTPGVRGFAVASGRGAGTVAAPGDVAGMPLVGDAADGVTMVFVTRDGRAAGFRRSRPQAPAIPPSSVPGAAPATPPTAPTSPLSPAGR